MTRNVEPTRTDRGFVVITDLGSSLKHVEICADIRANGEANNVFAEHVGVPDVVIASPDKFRRNGSRMMSTEQMEVFVDAGDQKLHVAPVANWDRVRQ